LSRPALLDVNVLIALFDAGHVHHEAAHDWFADNRGAGWATCATTENGFLRVLSHPRSPIETDVATLRTSLRAFCGSGGHAFWSESVSLRDDTLFNSSFALTHRQLTDVYLLALAARMGGRLATFDAGIPLAAVAGATPEHLALMAPA
jgi:uncharacterized protein